MATMPETVAEILSTVLTAPKIDQIAFLVEDLEESMRQWSHVYPLDQWRVYTYNAESIDNLTYRGAAGEFSMRLALVGSSPQLELIQPIVGPSIYDDWIQEHGYGFHHLGFFVPSLVDAIKRFESVGALNIQSGSGYGLDGDGGFAYFDLNDTHHIVFEAIEVPKRRRPSEPLTQSTVA